MRRIQISDDRGRRLPLCLLGDLPPGVDVATRNRVARANGHRLVNFASMLAWMVSGWATITLWRYFWGVPSGTAIWAELGIPLAGFAAASAVLWPVVWIYSIRRGAGRARQACLTESVCPSCGYTLTGLPLEADGCAVCPECSGAWRPVARER